MDFIAAHYRGSAPSIAIHQTKLELVHLGRQDIPEFVAKKLLEGSEEKGHRIHQRNRYSHLQVISLVRLLVVERDRLQGRSLFCQHYNPYYG